MAFKKKNARRGRRTSRRSKPTVKRAIRKVKKQRMSKTIRRVVNTMSETKGTVSDYTQTPYCLHNATTPFTDAELSANEIQIVPGAVSALGFDLTIPKGTGPNQREGNSVTLKRATLKYVLNARQYDINNNAIPRPVIARMYIFKDKKNPQAFLPVYDVIGDDAIFFKDNTLNGGGNGLAGFYGNITDNMYQLNTDRFQYLMHKDHKVGYAQYNIQGQGGTSSTGNQYWQNNDSKLFYQGSINIGKYLPKRIKWDNADNLVSGGIHVLWQIVSQTGETLVDAGPTVAHQKLVEVAFHVDLRYKDL